MPIEFRCPQCDKLLRVPDESAGAKAKCPQCQAIAEVPAAGDAASESPFSDGQPSANPFDQGAQPAQPSGESVNPYSSPATAYVPPKPSVGGEMVPTKVEVGDVISYAWETWKANIGILVGITVVVFGVNMGFGAVQGGVTQVLEQQGEQEVGALVGALISFVSNFVQIFLGIGQAQICLRLLRRQPAEFGQLFGGGPLFLRTLGASIIAGLVMVLGFMACIVPGILLLIFFWPFYFLIVDGKAKAFESFEMARAFAQPNAGTTIVLWLASVGIMLVGFLALCVGVLFAAPLVSVMWGAAYLMMSGQISTKPQYAA